MTQFMAKTRVLNHKAAVIIFQKLKLVFFIVNFIIYLHCEKE